MEARYVIENTLVPHTAFEGAMKRIKQCLAHGKMSPEPTCLALVGESGTGKSRALEETESLMPRSRNAEGAIVPILRVRAPARPTVKGVAGLLLQELGDPKSEVGTEISRTKRLFDKLNDCGTQIIMLDEFQHFFDKGTRKIFHDAADWLKILVDQTKVALVVSGLESCLPVIRTNEQLSRRFTAPVFMRRFNWLVESERAEFIGILEAFNASISEHFRVPELNSEEMAFRFWCASGGLIGYLTKHLRQAVWDVCDAEESDITFEHLGAAYDDAIWSAHGTEETVSPFSRSFVVDATQENILAALKVGTREVDQDPAPRSRRRAASAGPSVSHALKSRGA
ncbi:TniB family NTP-binding protein [Roseateles violae]|uniref:TniB family NTP-binding protein n=1 Tax=Roseateles violae TaxID=3058042 RepID=A0ABT8DW87_9BURK|nr:TniB family NTP-binding protein [Pelomonas sp. PFR6]MDN3922554.1 TniB family NTP-binding protein [Pelomonas sp. PFR6]